MKKAAFLMAVGLMLTANMVMAGIGPGDGTGIRVEGVIASIDTVNMQIVVDETTVQVTDSTIIKKNGKRITFADLAVGQTVAACGVYDGDVFVAKRVTVKYYCILPQIP